MQKDNVKNLLKILIGVAWLDGRIQPEERQYLKQVAKAVKLATDPEIKPFLGELKPVPPPQCYEWVREYLGDCPTTDACQNLIEDISGLIYSDGEVAIAEAQLLTKMELLHPANGTPQSGHNDLLKEIQKVYRNWVKRELGSV